MLSDLIPQEYSEQTESQNTYIRKAKFTMLGLAIILLLVLSF